MKPSPEESARQIQSELEELAAAISHDLRGSMRGVGNLATWAEEDLGSAIPEAARENFRLLRRQCAEADRYMQRLVEFGRAGKDGEGPKAPLSAVFERALRTLDDAESAKISVEEPPALELPLFAVSAILCEFLSNAVLHGRGESPCRVQAKDLGVTIEISVQDSGPGIDPRHHQKIFMLGHTLKPRDESQGQGVGLALARKLALRHGAVISLESHLGRGAKFSLSWPKNLPS